MSSKKTTSLNKKSPTRTKKVGNSKKSTNKKPTKLIYLDNNGTTLIADRVKKVYSDWLPCFNVSTDSKVAEPAKKAFDKAVDVILAHCGVNIATHTALFTSGATESNCLIIRSCVKAYKKKLAEKDTDLLPHIITSAIEHSSIMECIKDLYDCGDIDVTHIKPTIYGNVLPEDVESAIRPNTCLISIMFANNEIPVINNIKAISDVAKKNRVPLHSDCVQVFGKYKIDIKKHGIDALSASAHKFYGPKGVGVLIVNNQLINGYGLTGEISGTQQSGLRGGTINISAIVSMMEAVNHAFSRRKQKNQKLLGLRNALLEKLRSHYTFAEYEDYLYSYEERKQKFRKKDQVERSPEAQKQYEDNDGHEDLELISMGPPEDKASFILPNTVLLCICKNRGRPFCNVDLKHYLDNKGIVVSIGSACATSSKKASHVLNAINAPDVVKRGVIRISFGDDNTVKDVDIFVKELQNAIDRQCKDFKM